MAKVVKARLEENGAVSIRRGRRWEPVAPSADLARIDATTEEEIAAQEAQDDDEAARDAAAWARRVRRRTGLSQVEFARRIGVPTATVRSWEPQGAPLGAAGTLLRLIDRAPKVAMAVLTA
jgi:putative transcriptional regulator